MEALVTGGAGFIGSNLTRSLVEQGHTVRVLDDFTTGKKENLDGVSVDLVEGSIEDLDVVRSACEEVEIVFHQAALPSVKRSVDDPIRSHNVNANGTLNVLVSARDTGVRRVIYASSSSAYGDTPTLPKREDMPTSPQSPYAVSKLMGEYYCKVFTRVYRLETVSLRYFNVFGPRQDPKSHYAAVIPLFITALLNGDPPTVFGDGEQTRDFTYIDNVIQANLLAANSGSDSVGEAYNIACGERVALNRLIDVIAEILGTKKPAITYTGTRPGDIRHSLADIAKAFSLLGYEASTGLREGLEATAQWFSSQEVDPALTQRGGHSG